MNKLAITGFIILILTTLWLFISGYPFDAFLVTTGTSFVLQGYINSRREFLDYLKERLHND